MALNSIYFEYFFSPREEERRPTTLQQGVDRRLAIKYISLCPLREEEELFHKRVTGFEFVEDERT